MSRSGDDFLFDMAIDDVDSETMEWLEGQEFYREWQREQSENEKKFPRIAETLDGKGELFLTKEEHEAVVHYLDIQQKMEAAERREYYRFGHVHAQRYQRELGERNCHDKGRTIFMEKGDKEEGDAEQVRKEGQQDVSSLPDWLAGFIQRLDKILAEKLEQNPGWRKLKQDEQEILEKFPLILRLLEGDLVKSEITISKEEQRAFEEFFSLQLHMDSYKELELYMIGQGELVKYFRMLLS